jgi:hypothetical protein
VEFSPVLVYQPVRLATSERPYPDDKEAGARATELNLQQWTGSIYNIELGSPELFCSSLSPKKIVSQPTV